MKKCGSDGSKVKKEMSGYDDVMMDIYPCLFFLFLFFFFFVFPFSRFVLVLCFTFSPSPYIPIFFVLIQT